MPSTVEGPRDKANLNPYEFYMLVGEINKK